MNYEGHVDRVDNGVIFGWAWDAERQNDAIHVDVRVDDKPVRSVRASRYRRDLEAAAKGNGHHAFVFRLPHECLDGAKHTLRLLFGGSDRDLIGSPILFAFDPQRSTLDAPTRHREPQVARTDDGGDALDGASWVTALPNPPHPRTLRDIRLFAVLGTWMEADIVSATIRNAFTQGCERVYLVDNESTDGTAEIAQAEGAFLAHSFRTERYDERLRLRFMNDVVADVSSHESDAHLWWLFLDADEFPHGPSGMRLLDYLRTLDERFRIVGARFFDHYPSGRPAFVQGRHPLDTQPLCEEIAIPMCRRNHRKHPLQRYDRHGAAIECGTGFHTAVCAERLLEPLQPIFLHHFPFREEPVTRRRLDALWAKDANDHSRALESHDTHMLARLRSVDAVYRQDWPAVRNFLALDSMRTVFDAPPPPSGVTPRPWMQQVEEEHRHVLRWYSGLGAWKYGKVDLFHYGDDTTYKKGIAFLDGHGTLEDWGCGFTYARTFVTRSQYVGVDGSSNLADKIVDLTTYTSCVECIFMRHVLEHNGEWRRILANAVASFTRRMVLIIFTPFVETTRQIATSTVVTSHPVPDLSFRREDLTEYFDDLTYTEESLATDTQYGVEHIFYIEKRSAVRRRPGTDVAEVGPRALYDDADPFAPLESELNAWASAGLTARFWLRDDDARTDTPALRRLLALARACQVNVAVAVVPDRADRALVDILATAPCTVWQHGWNHDFHIDGEFGDARPLDEMIEDALKGQRMLNQLFGHGKWQPVFVPPNHMLSLAFKARLTTLGYVGVSAGIPLTAPLNGIAEVNAELDVMDWSAGQILGAAALGQALVDELGKRRRGVVANDAVGILTHHLAFDESAWNGLSRLLTLLVKHRAVTFVPPAVLFVDKASSQDSDVAKGDIAVVITSCGRQDLLEITLDSFFRQNTCPVRELVVIEDGSPDLNRELEERYPGRHIKWMATGRYVGQAAAIDMAYQTIETKYIFHCEDDWEFIAPGFMEKSLSILQQNEHVLQVWLRAPSDTNNHRVLDHVLRAGGTPYRILHPVYHSREWGTWHGFSWNPGLRRRKDYSLIGSFGALNPDGVKTSYEVEREASEFYFKRGFFAAILADREGGYVRHIGWGRRVADTND